MAERLGLTFSGGGFRASFYHIGVLAQMAEQGLLRHVEVISAVSGGSIIGALYYLHLKKLLESKVDADITDQDYVQIVQQIEVDFLKATENNIRMETFSSFIANFKMTSARYSRSDRLAELYNQHFYQTVLPEDAMVGNPVQMQRLKIYPLADDKNFHPNKHNAARKAKVPILVLNATTLNTGRNWQFTADSMGEPPERLDYTSDKPDSPHENIDKKTIRLRRADNYSEMAIVKTESGKVILNQQEIPLGHAVAASACVPGLFYPMSITGLYKDQWLKENQTITPQLVDGGVYDNQGTRGVLQHRCTCFIISDASGQMGIENEVATDNLSVLLRMAGILQDRVRSESLKHLLTRTGQGENGRRNVAFMDLRNGLSIREIAWIDEKGLQQLDKIIPASSQKFGVDPRVQESLSLMRTDLDAFTEVEAYSLMLDGYQMSESEFTRFKLTAEHNGVRESKTLPKALWKFSQIAPWMENPTADYLEQLEIAKAVPFKVLKFFPFKLGIPLVLVIAAIMYALYPQIVQLLHHSVPIYALLLVVVAVVLNKALPHFVILRLLRRQVRLIKRIAEVIGLLFATVFFKLYLKFINPLFLARGRLDELKKRDLSNR
jgi:NTE family protein